MTHASEQAERERHVFARFLEARALNDSKIDYESREPDEPDILCSFPNGERIAFELGEICNPLIAEVQNRRDTKNGQGFFTSDPSAARVWDKLSKSYDSQHPIELLLHWEGRSITTDDVVIATIEPILNSKDHVFGRVWYLGECGVYLVYESH